MAIKWDYKWIEENKNNYTVIKDFYNAYCITVNSNASYKSFQRCVKKIGFENPDRVGRVFHKWNDEWILEKWNDFHYVIEIYQQYIKYIGLTELELNYKTFCRHCTRKLKLSNNCDFTEEQSQWIKENYQIYGMYEIETAYKEKFGGYHNWQTLSKKAQKMKVFIDEKDRRMRQIETISAPIGSKTIDTRGNHLIKTENGWMPYHRYIWEQHNGKINDGDRVIFLDRNKNNLDINNLVCIPMNQLVIMILFNMFSDNPYITKAGVTWSELYRLLK